METIYLAAGCFWGVEAILKKQKGILSTKVGYMGGVTEHVTYKDVCRGDTQHAEVVKLDYDPKIITTDTVLNFFWRLHDPTQLNRQGVDIGTQYRSAIFYTTEEQKIVAIDSKKYFDQSNAFKSPSVTEISPAQRFWIGEDYHQDYFNKNPGHICHMLRPNL